MCSLFVLTSWAKGQAPVLHGREGVLRTALWVARVMGWERGLCWVSVDPGRTPRGRSGRCRLIPFSG